MCGYENFNVQWYYAAYMCYGEEFNEDLFPEEEWEMAAVLSKTYVTKSQLQTMKLMKMMM